MSSGLKITSGHFRLNFFLHRALCGCSPVCLKGELQDSALLMVSLTP